MLVSRRTSVRQRQNKSEIENKNKEATTYIYGDIGGWFGIDHEAWVKEFNNIKADTIHVRIDSGGGDIFAARAMKTAIMQSNAKTVAHIDGLAASAASFLAMGADEIEIVDGGFLMIHNALSLIDFLGYYNKDDMAELIAELEKEIDLHEKINESIANDYAKRTGEDIETVQGWMNEETWFTASDALEHKFVDRVYDGKPIESKYDLSIYDHVPDSLKEKASDVSKRTIERALRDVGLSNREAKILAKGYESSNLREEAEPEGPENQREVEPEEVVVEDSAIQDDDNPADEVDSLLFRVWSITK